MKKLDIIKFIICAAMLCCLASLTVSAEENVVIDDFDGEYSVSWSGGEFVSNLVFSDEGYLEVIGEESDSTELKTVNCMFASPVLMDDIKEISAKVYAEEIPGVVGYFVRIRLFGQSGDECESIVAIESGEWSEVSLDITEWKHKEIVTGLEIGLIPEHIDSGVWEGGFLVDDVVAVSFSDSPQATRFLFDEAVVEGGEIVFADDGSYFELVADNDSDETVIEFEVNTSSVAFADTLRINIENFSSSETMLVAFSDSDSFGRDVYTEIEKGGEQCVYYVKSGLKSPVKRVRIKFFGKGTIRFDGISLTDSYDNHPYITYGDITSVQLSADKRQIVISGELPREYVTEFENCKLYLYALEHNTDPRQADYDSMTPLSEHGISTKFTFRLDVGKQSGDALFKKYVVKISSTPKVFVDTPTYVTIGENRALAKGISVGYTSDDLSGVSASLSQSGIVDVSINRLVSSGNSGYMQASAGKYYYFDKSYVDQLDSKISALYSSGAHVIVRLTVDGKELDGLYFDSSPDSAAYLPNVTDERGSALVRAATEFLVTRYNTSRTGIINSFIVGKTVNAGRDISGAPNMSLTDIVNGYANAMRLVYIAATGSGADVRVYASVSDIYRNDFVILRNNQTDTEIFVKALGEYINDEGYFPWGVCAEEVSQGSGERINPTDKSAFKSFLADISSFSGAAAMIVTPIRGDGAEEIEAVIGAAELGFSGRYILSDTDASHTALIKAFNTGDRELLESIGINTKTYGELVSLGKIRTKKYSASSAAYKKPDKLMGSYVYYDFNTHTGIGNFNSSYFAKETRVTENRGETPFLMSVIEKNLYGEGTGALLSGVGASFDFPVSFALTPVLSFDVAVFPTDGADVKDADVIFRLVSPTRVYDSLVKANVGDFNTVFVDLGRYKGESFNSMQILVKGNKSNSLELCVDNITGYSYDYNDNGLSEAVNSSGAGGDANASDRNSAAMIITIAAVLLTLAASLVIIKSAHGNKNNDKRA